LPWCYIGKRQIEAALALYAEQNPWRGPAQSRVEAVQLNPQLPAEGMSRQDYVVQKFGAARAKDIYARVAGVGTEYGIAFAFDKIARQPNTVAAHSLIALAGAAGQTIDGLQSRVKEAFLQAYFLKGVDLTRPENLVAIRHRRRPGPQRSGAMPRRSEVAAGGGAGRPARARHRRRRRAFFYFQRQIGGVRRAGACGAARRHAPGRNRGRVNRTIRRPFGFHGSSTQTSCDRHPAPRASEGALAARLRREIRGEVLFDAASRGRYSTDASIYQIEPVGVVVPQSEEDARIAIEIAVEQGVPILPRGGGTSQCGQTVGAALVIDNSNT